MIKSIVTTTHESLQYPCLKINELTDIVVLFSTYGEGVVVNSGTSTLWRQGEYSTTWPEHEFVPFTGEVTLKNGF